MDIESAFRKGGLNRWSFHGSSRWSFPQSRRGDQTQKVSVVSNYPRLGWETLHAIRFLSQRSWFYSSLCCTSSRHIFFLTYESMTWTYCTWSYNCSNSLRWMILALLTTYCHWSSLFSQLIPCTIIFSLPVSLPSVPSTQLTNSFTKDPTTFLIFIIELPMVVAVKLRG